MDWKSIIEKYDHAQTEAQAIRTKLAEVEPLRKRLAELEEANKYLLTALDLIDGNRPDDLPEEKADDLTPTARILAEAFDVLTKAGHPMSSGKLWAALESRGIRIGGLKPASNLSAKLGRDARFRSFGRAKGWGVANPEPPEDGKPLENGQAAVPGLRIPPPSTGMS